MEAQGYWDRQTAYKHSNYRELCAVLMGVLTFKNQLAGKNVQVLSDNITTVAFVNNRGGSTLELDMIAREIHIVSWENNITLSAKYLSGINNWKADHLSRIKSTYEWKLHPGLFNMVDAMWGPHDIDRFASMMTSQLKEYNSLFWDPLSSGVDALAQSDWNIKNNYVNPPFALIPKVLDIIQNQKAVATLIAPMWRGQPWFQRLLAMSISNPIKLPVSNRTIIAIGPKCEPLKNVKWNIYAWRISALPDYVV